jgi:G3E family GTPase
MATLQQLQQNNPTQYQQVTQQIASNLKSAAATAQANGNTTQASELTQLSTDFSNASQNNQLPNVQDLAQAVAGGHAHGHHHHTSGTDTSSSDSSDANSLSQALSAFLAQSTSQQNSLNPLTIIDNTLTSAGISISS